MRWANARDSHGTTTAPSSRRDRDGDGGRRQHDPERDCRRHTHDPGDAPRRQDAEPDVLQGIDVLDHAVEQVAAVEGVQPGRGDALEPLVHGDTEVSEGTERSVVTDEALAVAEQAAGEGEEPHADHSEAEVGNRPVLGAA